MADQKSDKISTQSIFANAISTGTAHIAKQKAGKRVMTCPNCGAPRSENDPSLVCAYCDSELREAVDDG